MTDHRLLHPITHGTPSSTQPSRGAGHARGAADRAPRFARKSPIRSPAGIVVPDPSRAIVPEPSAPRARGGSRRLSAVGATRTAAASLRVARGGDRGGRHSARGHARRARSAGEQPPDARSLVDVRRVHLPPQPDPPHRRLRGAAPVLASRTAQPDPRPPRLRLRVPRGRGRRHRDALRADEERLWSAPPRCAGCRPEPSAPAASSTSTRSPTRSRKADLVTLHVYSPPLRDVNLVPQRRRDAGVS